MLRGRRDPQNFNQDKLKRVQLEFSTLSPVSNSCVTVVYLYNKILTRNREEVHSVVHTDPMQQHGGVSKALCHIEVVKHKVYKIL